jgi:hypothetical protein
VCAPRRPSAHRISQVEAASIGGVHVREPASGGS